MLGLAEVRRDFKTKLTRQLRDGDPPDPPSADLFRLVRYPSPAGQMAAYLGNAPRDGKRRPAIIWLFGGFSNSISETAWKAASPGNDQSASAFRKAGIIMMYPSLRGGNDNPGWREGFYGEVDDVIAAADFLAKQEGVDPNRIYLGGHSTGGTLAMLVAESCDRFRAVFSFGAVDQVSRYGAEDLPFDLSNPKELQLRQPLRWLSSIHRPLFVFEGMNSPSNAACLLLMQAVSKNPQTHFYSVNGVSHFSVLGALTPLIADRIIHDDGQSCSVSFDAEELNRLASARSDVKKD